ncbi:MAG: hypothetical protein A2161_09555 [Candidatus Schekmanbacteria bacterium RBG_13_48_7]|uniref:Uncharacterized protein n=1 Tax=Candidatus Schekmanbacteria bacterium RBG_13_48_7 TaxID=1817878 RepID=A0A1F7RYG4_9BACT|nr:MAG: hypothetical protein A2161_09555 [Candidatus Schekmanbacteria bacterium RBG_13_48_7]
MLIVVMAIFQRNIGSLSVLEPSGILFAWMSFLLLNLRKYRCTGSFFAWSSLVSAFLMVSVPFASALIGLKLGRCDPFPAHLIMFPTVALLILVSFVSALVSVVGFFRRNLRKSRGGEEAY